MSGESGAGRPGLAALAAWARADPVVLTSPRPDSVVTVADLATEGVARRLADAQLRSGASDKAAWLTTLHLAAGVAVDTVLAPYVWDRVRLEAGPASIGLEQDASGETVALWLDPATPYAAARDDPAASRAIGRLLGDLVRPVADAAGLRARVGPRVRRQLAFEALSWGVCLLDRRAGGLPGRGVVLLAEAAAASLGVEPAMDLLACRVDPGPPVMLPARSVCCVLSSAHRTDSCPGCPLLGTAEHRIADAVAWLSSLDDAEFGEVSGRDRVR